jgi:CRP-like cAMP-binding protein
MVQRINYVELESDVSSVMEWLGQKNFFGEHSEARQSESGHTVWRSSNPRLYFLESDSFLKILFKTS